MLLMIEFVAALSAVVGGTFGVERLFDRYAIPEAKSQASLTDPERCAEAERST